MHTRNIVCCRFQRLCIYCSFRAAATASDVWRHWRRLLVTLRNRWRQSVLALISLTKRRMTERTSALMKSSRHRRSETRLWRSSALSVAALSTRADRLSTRRRSSVACRLRSSSWAVTVGSSSSRWLMSFCRRCCNVFWTNDILPRGMLSGLLISLYSLLFIATLASCSTLRQSQHKTPAVIHVNVGCRRSGQLVCMDIRVLPYSTRILGCSPWTRLLTLRPWGAKTLS